MLPRRVSARTHPRPRHLAAWLAGPAPGHDVLEGDASGFGGIDQSVSLPKTSYALTSPGREETPDVSSPLYTHALSAYRAGEWVNAERLCREILARDPNDFEAMQLLGVTRRARNDLSGAEALLRRASALAPGNASILSSLGNVLIAQGAYDDARDVLRTALEIDPNSPWALQSMGNLLTLLGDLSQARALFERALAASPGHPHILASLAALSAKEGRYDDCERQAKQALGVAPRIGSAHLALAEAYFARGAYPELIDNLTPILEWAPPPQRVDAHGLIGRAQEKLGKYDHAFAAFAAANKIRAHEAPHYLAMASTSSLPSIARLTELMRSTGLNSWSTAPEAERSPVFLTGFPRSGTTLLEQALASHPEIEALDERDTIEGALGPLLLDDAMFKRWPALTPGEIAGFRAAYWRSVEEYLGRPLHKPVFVDKQPLALAQLPLIHRIFPKAKILFALRDPRDVVLSCFQQNFVLNPALVHFLTLEGTARYYDAANTLAELSRTKLPLDLHMVRYGDLVGDFRGTMEKTIAFLGLDWDERVMRYAETAKTRNVRTPSAQSVQQPIYDTALDRWRHYKESLEPVLPILAPWTSVYGFAPA